jgi:hypothetical protein
MASYLATVHIGDLREQSYETDDGLLIRNYFPVSVYDAAVEKFSGQDEMIAYFDDLFGPYPFEAYGAVITEENLGFALETQTISTFGLPILQATDDLTIAHELAHMWFGDSVSPAQWRDIWLNEGFASYSEILWLEETKGERARDREVLYRYRVVDLTLEDQPDDFKVAEPPSNDLFNFHVYWRGALTLHALRLRVGDETFFNILRAYTDRFRYRHVTTMDFINVAEEFAGEPLMDLFGVWIYQTELPEFPELEAIEASLKEIVFSPISNLELGVSTVAPLGWEEPQSGIYARQLSPDDPSVLVINATSGSASDVADDILESIQRPLLDGPDKYNANGRFWSVYQFGVAGTSRGALGVVEVDSRTYLVLFETFEDEFDALYTELFLPVLDALEVAE